MPLLILTGLFPLFADAKVPPENKDSNPGEEQMHVLCYRVSSTQHIERQIEDLKNQLEKLETMYKQGKIDEKSYNLRKTTLEKSIESFKSE